MLFRLITVLQVAPYLSLGVKIEITHWNDISGQIESFVPGTSDSPFAPQPCPTGSTNCIGGVVNLVNHITRNITDYTTEPDVVQLRLSAGNLMGGETGWISAWGEVSGNGWKLFGEFIQKHFKPDVMALGMKEFGVGVERTLDFVNAVAGTNPGNITNSILANTCKDPNLEPEFCSRINQTIELEDELFGIGIIGFVNPTVERLALPGKLAFDGVVDTLKEVVGRSSSNITTFIAIGDGNLSQAKEIMDNVEKIKLVIYSSAFPNALEDTYPLPYKQGFIATAGRYGSSIGKLVVDWEPISGNISVDARSKLVYTVLTQLNREAQEASTAYSRDIRTAVNQLKEELVGYSRVGLQDGKVCWRRECNLGNIVTDSMVHCVLSMAHDGEAFPHPLHSIWHGGAFFKEKVQAGNVSKFDIHKWLPFHNRAHLVKAKGSDLLKVFEKSASGINPDKVGEKDWGQFLQVSRGIEVSYSTEDVPTLTGVRMTQDNAEGLPEMGDLEESKDYYLVIPTYLYEGRGLYEFATFWEDVQYANYSNIGFDDDCVANYLRAWGQVSVGVERRIMTGITAIPTTPGDGEENTSKTTNAPGDASCLQINYVLRSKLVFAFVVAVIHFGSNFTRNLL